MKATICYYSRHHRNTLKVLEAIAEENDIDLIDVTSRAAVHLERYDAVGFASGIYYSKFHDSVTSFARQYLPEGKGVFFIYTCGSMRDGYIRAIAEAVTVKHVVTSFEQRSANRISFYPFLNLRNLCYLIK